MTSSQSCSLFKIHQFLALLYLVVFLYLMPTADAICFDETCPNLCCIDSENCNPRADCMRENSQFCMQSKDCLSGCCHGKLCRSSDDCTTYLTITIVVITIFLVASFAGFFIYLYRLYKQEQIENAEKAKTVQPSQQPTPDPTTQQQQPTLIDNKLAATSQKGNNTKLQQNNYVNFNDMSEQSNEISRRTNNNNMSPTKNGEGIELQQQVSFNKSNENTFKKDAIAGGKGGLLDMSDLHEPMMMQDNIFIQQQGGNQNFNEAFQNSFQNSQIQNQFNQPEYFDNEYDNSFKNNSNSYNADANNYQAVRRNLIQ